MAVLVRLECEGCHRHAVSVHLPRELTLTPDQLASQKTSEDAEVEAERRDANSKRPVTRLPSRTRRSSGRALPTGAA
jgi:hypothetical protein